MPETLYDWSASRNLSDWKFEGAGEIFRDDDGALHVRTWNCGPLHRASNAWLHRLELPENFEVEWSYRKGSQAGKLMTGEGVMIIFNALPVALKDLFEDPRPNARYSDLHSYHKLVCYTCGYFRAPYGGASLLRKLGGKVPMTWGESNLVSEDGKAFEEITVLEKGTEPLSQDDIEKTTQYKIRKAGHEIAFWCNGKQVLTARDEGSYRYWPEPLSGGKMAFRQWNGYVDNWYEKIIVRKL